jgi:hypothetical protein
LRAEEDRVVPFSPEIQRALGHYKDALALASNARARFHEADYGALSRGNRAHMKWIIDGLDVMEPALQDSRLLGIVLVDVLERSRVEPGTERRCQGIKRRVQGNNEMFERDLEAMGEWRRVANECIRSVERKERKGRVERCWGMCKTSYKRVLRRK